MRYKGTFILLIVVILLGFYLYFIELPGQKAKQQEEEKSKKVASFEPHDVVGIYLGYTKRSTDQEILLEKDPEEKWQIVKPIAAPADPSEVQGLLSSINNMRIERVVEEKPQDLKVYGLDEPEVKLSLKLKDSEEHLLFGDPAPVGSTVYIKKAGEDPVRLVDQFYKTNLTKTVADLRKKEVLDLDAQHVKRLSLHYPNQNFGLANENGQWWIKKPIVYRADDDEVAELLDSLKRLKATDFVDQARPDLLKGFRDPRLKVELEDENKKLSSLAIYQVEDRFQNGQKTYAVTHPEHPIYVIESSNLTDFEKDLFTLKDKHLLHFNPDQVHVVEIRESSRGAITLRREGNSWRFEGQAIEASQKQRINDFLKDLSDLKAEKRVDETPTSANPYGLNPPEVQIDLFNAQQTRLAGLLIGSEKDNLVYARSALSSPSEEDIFMIKAQIIQDLPQKADLEKPAAENSSS
jgi:hypothetical protein